MERALHAWRIEEREYARQEARRGWRHAFAKLAGQCVASRPNVIECWPRCSRHNLGGPAERVHNAVDAARRRHETGNGRPPFSSDPLLEMGPERGPPGRFDTLPGKPEDLSDRGTQIVIADLAGRDTSNMRVSLSSPRNKTRLVGRHAVRPSKPYRDTKLRTYGRCRGCGGLLAVPGTLP
jgi:hypothetical protein